MEEKNISLSNSEWLMMECLWSESPKTMMQLVKEMETKTGWAKSTTKTVISRMENKKYIRYEQGEKARQYYPNVTRENVVLSETEEFITRVYHGSLRMLVNTFLENKNLSNKEIDDLYQILERAREESGND